ncbi:DUF4238 domain-containing protein [Xanthobacter flavus]|uniref:DUF4238 domain-containing protein n=1 Tax=Xanthobacter flavus TaxID=281 RepID=UPI00372881A2
MSRPRAHHFVPQFLLRRWADADGRVQAWRWDGGQVRNFRVRPSETANVRNLYARELVPADERDKVERFLGALEARAAAAIDATVSGDFSLLPDEHLRNLAVFMIASHVRLPHHIDHMRAEGRRLVEEALSRPDPDFERLNTTSARNLLEWTRQHHPARIANFGIDTLPGVVLRGGSLDKLLKMKWMLSNFETTPFEVLLSDRPLVLYGGIDNPHHLQAFAIGPRHIIFAAPSGETLTRITRWLPRDVVRGFNQAVVGQCARFAYGRAEARFIEKFLPRSPPASRLLPIGA